LTDGLNTAPPFAFRVRVSDVNLHLVRNEALNVFPMMQTPLTKKYLLIAASDFNPEREIVFVVKRGPRQGRMLFRDQSNRLVETRNFTQRQVNASSVYYEHNRPFSNLTIYDAVELEASSDYSSRGVDVVFHVAISVSAMMPGGIDRFIGTDVITLEEGGTAIVYSRDDKPNFHYMINYRVSHMFEHNIATNVSLN
jgi:hypothetical protein